MSLKTKLQPYLFFDGRCEEALEFYKKALGAKVTMRNKDAPEQPPPGKLPPGSENKVMHCEVQIGDVEFMGSDGFASGHPSFKGFALSLTLPDEKAVNEAFKGLADVGKIDMPLSKTFWADRFGMVTDRFGIQWMLTTPHRDVQVSRAQEAQERPPHRDVQVSRAQEAQERPPQHAPKH